MDILSMGELLIDLKQAGKNEIGVPQYAANPGGAPANLAVAASRLGAKAGFIGKVGADAFGEYLGSVLKENGVDVRGLLRDPNHPTTLAVVSGGRDEELSYSFYRAQSADTMLAAEEIDPSLFENTKFFHFGSVSMTAEPERSATIAAVRMAKKAGCIISYDPNYRPSLWENEEAAVAQMKAALPLADILKVSRSEMELLTGKKDPAEATRDLSSAGIFLVLVTLGAEGAFYRFGEKTGIVPGFKVRIGDTIGAGDTFLGAVLAALSKEADSRNIPEEKLREIIAFGNRAASVTVSRQGAVAAMPLPEEVEKVRRETLNVILLGAPGCGKGSLTERLQEEYNIHHFSTGDMLREAIRNGTEIGKQAEAIIDQGRFVSDDIVLNLIREKLDSIVETTEDGTASVNLFDGFPRTLSQAEALEKILAEKSNRVDGVLAMECDEETIVSRAANRCICRNCSFIGNIHNIGVAADGKRHCPRCGGEIYQRKDDRPEVIRSRMEVYHEQTEPLHQYYKDKKVLFHVDASGSLSATEDAANRVLDHLQRGVF